jgi:MFS family permease
MNDHKTSLAGDVDYRLLLPFLLHAILVQAVTGLTRVTTSYRAIELDFSVSWYGAISSGYALLPIFGALPLGRWIDRGNDARAIWIGSAFNLLGALGLWLAPNGPWSLLTWTVIGGVGHIFLMAGHQMFVVRCAGPKGRESVLGHYMVALAFGQMLGPIMIGWTAGAAAIPPTGQLFLIAACVSAIGMVLAFAMVPAPEARRGGAGAAPVSLRDLLRVNGLVPVILASVVTVTSIDLVLIYLPLLGAERGLSAGHVGALLTTRAIASIASRLVYARMIAMFGRASLTFGSMLAGAIGFIVMAAPVPLPVMYAAMVAMGLGLGLSIVLCLSNVVELAPVEARGTAMTMRLTGNRIGQFAIPFAAGFLGAAAGVGAILGVTAAGLLASALAVRRALRR